ncbi:MAG: HAD family phosphatase [Phycisphaerales bacterium]|nr:MAG: HAD family phosphatase [Phycisphaerales bacterium]
MLRAVIFDFDGVITDSEILHFRAFNEVLGRHGIKITTKDYYGTYLGFSDADCFKLLVKQGRLEADERGVADLIRQKNAIFEELASSEGRIIEGVREFLCALEQNDVPMAICSGALLAEIELILQEARLRNFFDVIVAAEHVEKGKPDPEGFLLTLEKLNTNATSPISARQCVVVEDSHWGLRAAIAAGMHAVAVTNTYDADQLSMSEKTVGGLGELTVSDLQQLCR